MHYVDLTVLSCTCRGPAWYICLHMCCVEESSSVAIQLSWSSSLPLHLFGVHGSGCGFVVEVVNIQIKHMAHDKVFWYMSHYVQISSHHALPAHCIFRIPTCKRGPCVRVYLVCVSSHFSSISFHTGNIKSILCTWAQACYCSTVAVIWNSHDSSAK